MRTQASLNSVCHSLELMPNSATGVMPWQQDILKVQPGKILLWLLQGKAVTLELYVLNTSGISCKTGCKNTPH